MKTIQYRGYIVTLQRMTFNLFEGYIPTNKGGEWCCAKVVVSTEANSLFVSWLIERQAIPKLWKDTLEKCVGALDKATK